MEELIKELQAQKKTLSLIEATDGVEVSRIFQTIKDKDKIFDSITIVSTNAIKGITNSKPEQFQSIDQYYRYLTQEVGKKSSEFLGSNYGIGIICTKEVKGNVGNSALFISIYDKLIQASYNCKPMAVNCNDSTMPTTITMYIIKQLNAILRKQKENVPTLKKKR